jgi:hypothetical protein
MYLRKAAAALGVAATLGITGMTIAGPANASTAIQHASTAQPDADHWFNTNRIYFTNGACQADGNYLVLYVPHYSDYDCKYVDSAYQLWIYYTDQI